jgi:hypothetical protein
VASAIPPASGTPSVPTDLRERVSLIGQDPEIARAIGNRLSMPQSVIQDSLRKCLPMMAGNVYALFCNRLSEFARSSAWQDGNRAPCRSILALTCPLEGPGSGAR